MLLGSQIDAYIKIKIIHQLGILRYLDFRDERRPCTGAPRRKLPTRLSITDHTVRAQLQNMRSKRRVATGTPNGRSSGLRVNCPIGLFRSVQGGHLFDRYTGYFFRAISVRTKRSSGCSSMVYCDAWTDAFCGCAKKLNWPSKINRIRHTCRSDKVVLLDTAPRFLLAARV
jgi:hypothetical protein